MKTHILITSVILGTSPLIKAQSIIDSYLTSTPKYTTIGTSANKISAPRDLDFKPNSNELWVVNNGTSSVPGSGTITFYNPGKSNQLSRYRRDSNANHFLRMGSAIAFGENGLWANTNESDNGGNRFMGPSLWPSDSNIYAKVHQNDNMLGSHCDMLHQSSFAMGIAHETGNVYWVFDGYSQQQNICRYDFVIPHEYGGDDHSDGKIWRYTDVKVKRVANVPSHMIIDKATGMLYIADTGNKRIIKMDIKSGTKAGNLSQSSEPLAGYYEMTRTTASDYVSSGLVEPCGIDFYKGRLIVTDHSNGDIIIYNTTGTSAVEMGRIKTGSKGIMGVVVGPDEKIWYVDNVANKVIRIDPGSPTNIEEITNDAAITVYPNPASSAFNISYVLNKSADITIQIMDSQGKLVDAIYQHGVTGSNLIELTNKAYPSGMYLVKLSAGTENYFKKLVVY